VDRPLVIERDGVGPEHPGTRSDRREDEDSGIQREPPHSGEPGQHDRRRRQHGHVAPEVRVEQCVHVELEGRPHDVEVREGTDISELGAVPWEAVGREPDPPRQGKRERDQSGRHKGSPESTSIRE